VEGFVLDLVVCDVFADGFAELFFGCCAGGEAGGGGRGEDDEGCKGERVTGEWWGGKVAAREGWNSEWRKDKPFGASPRFSSATPMMATSRTSSSKRR
jgi:hypothetical protein